MRILITGTSGQVGGALARVLAPAHTILAPTSAELDIADASCTAAIVAMQPEIVVHPAAFTNVDRAAREPELAFRVNAMGTRHVALACRELNVPLAYVSTNEVFDGSATEPYHEWDQPAPINAYARSKWAGEQFVREIAPHWLIARVAWVFGGERNFVRTIQRLASERDRLSVVDDEIGNPTFATDIATAIAALIARNAIGTVHLVNAGACSRYAFAREILNQTGHNHIAVDPIRLRDFKRDSTVPAYTALRNNVAALDYGVQLRPWQDALNAFLAETQTA